MLILVADDDLAGLLIAVTALREMGHECCTATDGDTAWELFQTRRPDVVVCDWLMPGINGPELCRRIRSHPARYTYVIMVTSQGARDQIVEAMTSGADDYLVKPLDVDDLDVRLIAAERVSTLHRRLAHERTKLVSSARSRRS